jgi:hypothetical protein
MGASEHKIETIRADYLKQQRELQTQIMELSSEKARPISRANYRNRKARLPMGVHMATDARSTQQYLKVPNSA